MQHVYLVSLVHLMNVWLAAFQVDGSKMSPDYRVPPIVVYERKDSKWTLKDKHT